MKDPTFPERTIRDSASTPGYHDARAVAGRLDASLAVPDPLTRRFGDGIVSVAWVNEVGGVTVRGMLGGEQVFAKWAPQGSELDLAAEAERLTWAAPYVTVPEVVDFSSGDGGDVLITRALPGENAVHPRWLADPRGAVRALGEGLRTLHEVLPVAECPYSWRVEDRIARSSAEGIPDRVAQLAVLGDAPPVERLVVCHADACAPNTLLAEDGSVAGYVDLGRLGVGDRWADIAIGAWSTVWNYGAGYESLYYDSYGIQPDEERIAYYRALWDAT